jgi:hypothetical protein
MQCLFWRKISQIFLAVMVCLFVPEAKAQIYPTELNLEDHDRKPIHFGILLGFNQSHYNISHHPFYLGQDSVSVVESVPSTGISLGWLVNLRLGQHFDLRTYPLHLVFTEKVFQYKLTHPNTNPLLGPLEEPTMNKKVQGITLALPVQFKFSSDRINNFKVFMLAGGKIEYDFAANAGEKNAELQMKLKKMDFGMEAGLGFHFYFPVFVLTPELKVGWGFNDVHARDANLKYSNVLDKIKARTVSLSFIIE